MPVQRGSRPKEKASTPNFVSGRFLTDLFRTLEANGIPATRLIGDLPISLTPTGETHGDVEWSAFAEFMKRLEVEVGGPAGLESCAMNLSRIKPAPILRGLAGLSASPHLLFRAATRWALKRAMPGIDAWVAQTGDNQLYLHARIHEDLRGCPQIFHFAAGASRGLPRILGLSDAVVDADIDTREAHYRITLPPSPNLFARARRFLRTLFSAGSVLQHFESQQLELHAQHEALRNAHANLRGSEQRYRALTDAVVDVLCELDLEGRIVYVSASAQDLVGYTPEQLTGSNFRLWIPKKFHARAAERFEALVIRPPGGALTRELVTLHADSGSKIVAELSVRSYVNSDGEWRLAASLRDVTDLVEPQSSAAAGHSGRQRVDAARIEERRTALRPHLNDSEAHPLARSLGRLVAALDSLQPTESSASSAALTHAAESMTRIVHNIDAAKMRGETRHETIELHKLMEAVRLEFTGRPQVGSQRLRCQLATGPAEIQASSGLLTVGLLSLLDVAAGRAESAESLLLSAAKKIDSTGRAALEFRIEIEQIEPGILEDEPHTARESRPSVSGGSRIESDAELDDEFWALSESIAGDVAAAHDGEVAIGTNETGRPCFWLRIPLASTD